MIRGTTEVEAEPSEGPSCHAGTTAPGAVGPHACAGAQPSICRASLLPLTTSRQITLFGEGRARPPPSWAAILHGANYQSRHQQELWDKAASRSTLLPGKPSGFLWSKRTSSNVLLRDSERQKDEQPTWKKRKARKGISFERGKGEGHEKSLQKTKEQQSYKAKLRLAAAAGREGRYDTGSLIQYHSHFRVPQGLRVGESSLLKHACWVHVGGAHSGAAHLFIH